MNPKAPQALQTARVIDSTDHGSCTSTEFQPRPPILASLLAPFTVQCSRWLKKIRRDGIEYYPRSRRVFEKTGVFPIEDHCYEPRSTFEGVGFDAERSLPSSFWI